MFMHILSRMLKSKAILIIIWHTIRSETGKMDNPFGIIPIYSRYTNRLILYYTVHVDYFCITQYMYM